LGDKQLIEMYVFSSFISPVYQEVGVGMIGIGMGSGHPDKGIAKPSPSVLRAF
jgi:hypothetical protein